jgi:hypothetical protein
MEFCIIFSLQCSISINTFEVDPLSGALLGVSCDSRQGPFLGDSAVLKSRLTTVKKGEKATATLFYLFSTATALYFKKQQRRWHRKGSDIQSTQVSVMGLA